MDSDQIIGAKTKIKEIIQNECAKTLIDIDSYTSMATAHPYASHEDIEHAIQISRAAQDSLSLIKSDALIKIDNIARDMQTQNI